MKSLGVLCPVCGGRTRVSTTRRQQVGNSVMRRRDCLSCGHRFRTTEDPIEMPGARGQRNAVEELGARYLALDVNGRAVIRRLLVALEGARSRPPAAMETRP